MKVHSKIIIKMSDLEENIILSFLDAVTEACGKSNNCSDCPYHKYRNIYDSCPVDLGVLHDVFNAFSESEDED